ncbi:MAG: XRE family transcriptional regulator [Clostridia bacterium]|nr:XRE family transcriptional regulator [Clostridia bacterium]
MRIRTQKLGDSNLIGERLTKNRKAMGLKQQEFIVQLQINGVDLSSSALSKIEGQHRIVTDKELSTIADVLNVTTDYLLGRKLKKHSKS